MNKKILFLILVCLLAIALAGCNTETGVEADKVDTEITQKKVEEKVDKKQLDKILVSYKANSSKEMQVDIKNTSDKVFTGDIHVYFFDKNGKEVGYDMLMIEDLKAGNTGLCNVRVEATPDDMDYSFSSEFKFTDDKIAEGKLNEELTTELATDLADSFGNEYFTAEWYPSIKSVEVFSTDDEINYIVATVSEGGDEIGNILFGNYVFGDKSDFVKVIVKNEDGNTVFTKSK